MAERHGLRNFLGARSDAASALVVGLGRFGTAVARTLESLDADVLGIDVSPAIVQQRSDELNHVVAADATDPDTLVKLGALDFEVAVVAVGSSLEASILATAALDGIGHPLIWAKALSDRHGSILERVGAHHVVYPEKNMGERVGHAVAGRAIDWFVLDEDFALAETTPPRDALGRTLAESGLRDRYGITVVAIKPSGGQFTYATPDTRIGPDDLLLVAGPIEATDRFCKLAP